MLWLVATFAVLVAVWGASTDTIRQAWRRLNDPPEHTGMRRAAPYVLEGGRRRRGRRR